MHKAHVQHPVGLVQHKNFQVGQVDEALPDQVVQTARAGDQDVHALFQGLHLGCLAHAAENDGAAQAEVLAVGVEALADLQGQLAGRGEDQRTDGPLFPGGVGSEPVQHGQRKGSRLAGTGLGTAHQIPAGQHRRDRRRLNGRRGLIARLLHSAQQGGGQIQFFKCHGSPNSSGTSPLAFPGRGKLSAQQTDEGALITHICCPITLIRHFALLNATFPRLGEGFWGSVFILQFSGTRCNTAFPPHGPC